MSYFFFFQAEDGIRDLVRSRGLGDVYKRQGRAVVNLLNLAEGEKIADCRAIRDFTLPDHHLMMATRKGLVKKLSLIHI